MASRNLEIVRLATNAYNRRDFDGIVEHWAPDAVVDWSNSRGFEGGIYRGHDAIQFIREFLEAFEEVQIDLEEVREIGEGVVVAENFSRMKGRDGIEVEARSAWVLTFEDGMQTSLTLHQTMEDALEAVGAT